MSAGIDCGCVGCCVNNLNDFTSKTKSSGVRSTQSVAFLRDYANRHFQAEEDFMEKHAYPHLEQHRKLHTEFLEMLDGLVADLALYGPSQHLADRALEISQEWLINHIIEEDTRYAQYIKEKINPATD